jgi:hypothetical protein
VKEGLGKDNVNVGPSLTLLVDEGRLLYPLHEEAFSTVNAG